MTELAEIKQMLQKHVDDSNKFRERMITDVAVVKNNAQHAANTVERHDKEIREMKTAHNRQKGALWALGIIWSALLALLGLTK